MNQTSDMTLRAVDPAQSDRADGAEQSDTQTDISLDNLIIYKALPYYACATAVTNQR